MKKSFVGALGIYTAGGLFWAFLPYFIGLNIDAGDLDEAQAGLLGSGYLIGFSFASVGGLWWVSKVNWRISVVVAAATIVACLWVLQAGSGFFVQLGAVFLIGVMMGSYWTLAYRIFATTDDPDRSFAIGIVVSYTALAALSFVMGNYVVADFGMVGATVVLGGVISALALGAFLIPAKSGQIEANVDVSYRPPVAIGAGLVGLLATGLAFAAVWAFAERIGVAAGFDASLISPVIASNLLATAGGSVIATIMGSRFGRSLPIFVGLALLAGSILMLLGANNFWFYAAGLSGLGIFVGFVMPYQMGAIGTADKAGQFVVLIAAAQGLGSAIGSYGGGIAFQAGGIGMLTVLSTVSLLVAALAFIPITRQGDRS